MREKRIISSNMSSSGERTMRLASYASLGLLSFLSLTLLFPYTHSNASADDLAPLANDSTSSLSISIPHSMEATIAPTADGSFAMSTAELRVTTTASDGYKLYIYASDGTQYLSSSNGRRLDPVSGTPTSSAFSPNTWGYYLGSSAVDSNTKYSPIPISTSTALMSIDTSSTHGASDSYHLAIGAKIGATLPSGEYKNSINVRVIAEPKQITSLAELTYMQEMTSAICTSTPEHVEKQLIDERDNNSYYVTKLRDGNCWMTQNLALDLDGTKIYGGQTEPGVPIAYVDGSTGLWEATGITTGTSYKTNSVYTENQYVLGQPAPGFTDSCKDGSAAVSDIRLCNRFKNISSGYTQALAAVNAQGQVTAYNATAKTYDPHYLAGNIYKSTAAVAGTNIGNKTINANLPASICPMGADSDRNWILPLGGDVNASANGSFGKLLTQYNAQSDVDILARPPISLVRSGTWAAEVGFMGQWGMGENAIYLSRTISSSTSSLETVLKLSLGASTVTYIEGDYYNNGNVRCLYLGN